MQLLNTKNKYKKQKGTALVYVLIMMSIVTIIIVSMIGYVTSQIKYSYNRVEKEKAFQVAEAGIQYYKWYLAHNTSGKTAEEIEAFWAGNSKGINTPYIGEVANDIGQFSLTVERPTAGSTFVMVTSTGNTFREPNLKRTIRVRFRRPSWSEFMMLTNGSMKVTDDMEIFGKVHSNTGIRFDGIAHNLVTSLVPSYDDPTHGGSTADFGVHTHKTPADPAASSGTVPNRPDVFEAGREFPVEEVSFSGVTTDLGFMKAKAQAPSGTIINNCSATGCYFDATGEGRQIILKSNGTFDVCIVDAIQASSLKITKYKKTSGTGTCSACSGECVANYNIPNNGVIFVENNTWVHGSVDNKRITIAAANLIGGTAANIYIGTGNIRYSNYTCANKIGLVAQKDITAVKDSPDEFIIDGILMAQTGRVGVNNTGFSHSEITINGAVASYLEPEFNNGVNGFAVRIYNFDNNSLYCPPSYFPTGTEYSIDLWEEL